MLLAFTACKKDQVDPISQKTVIDNTRFSEVSIENGVVAFESVDAYISIITSENEGSNVDALIEEMNTAEFNSYGDIHGSRSTYQDPFMDAIMNKDQIVKIGEWFVSVDLPSEKVLVISESETDAYQQLLVGSGQDIREFNIGDDVLDHLIENSSPQDRGCGGIGGGTYSSNVVSGGGVNHQAYVKFFRAGIYFKLSCGFNTNVGYPSSTAKSMEVLGPEGWCKRRNCGSGTIKTLSSGVLNSNLNNNVYYQYKFYENVRNLNGYYFYVRLKVDNTYSTWCGRNINSPH